jgi:hypothetical protein
VAGMVQNHFGSTHADVESHFVIATPKQQMQLFEVWYSIPTEQISTV